MSLFCVVTAPTTRPAPTIAASASACGNPMTSGTRTGAGPKDTTRSTALPGATGVPPVGSWLITEPAGTVSLFCVVTAPTTRPAPTIAASASACGRPTTFGTATRVAFGGLMRMVNAVPTVPRKTSCPLSLKYAGRPSSVPAPGVKTSGLKPFKANSCPSPMGTG